MTDEITLQMRHRTLLILWLAMLMNVGVLFSMTVFLLPPDAAREKGILRLVFVAVALLLVIASFIVRAKMFDRARDLRAPQTVHVAFVIAWAMCEASSLLGLVEYFTIGSRNLFLFGLSLLGMALHLPRIEHLESVGIKK